MPFTTAGLNKMITALDGATTAVTLYLALHTGDTPTSGNEISGGSYARQSVTFGAAANGVRTTSGDRTFNVPAGATVASITIYDAASAGNMLALVDSANEVYTGAGTYTVLSGASVGLTA